MATDTTDLKVRFDAEWADFERGAAAVQKQLDATARKAERANHDMNALQKQVDDDAAAQWDRQASAMDATGRAMVGFGAAAALGLGYAAKAAIDWESAWAGVTKTVDASGSQLNKLEGDLRGIATSMPASHDEIAAVAEAAGQLGVKTGNIADFTRVMVMLGTSTNLSAEDAANGLARFANVMGTSQKDVDRLGASLVALGNDGASTESEILEMAQRISGAGKQLDLTEGETLGLANALSSVGINAEAGGSSMSQLLVTIQGAVSEGGAAVEGFAKVAGVSADQFKEKFGKDAAGAFDLFIQGLGRMKERGGDTLGTLKSLGITQIRQRDAVLRLAGAGNLLTKSLKLGNSSWKDNTALIKEAEKRYETTESKAKIAFNTFQDGAIDIGNILLPAIAKVVDTGADLLRFFNSAPGPIKTVGTVLAVTGAAVALVGGAALIAVPKIVAFKTAVDGLSAGPLKSAGRGLSRFAGLMTGPWGAALGIGLTALTFWAAKQGETQQEIAEVTDTLNEQTGAITKNTREWVASKIADELGDVADSAKTAGISMEQLANAALGDPAALDPIIDKYNELKDATDAGVNAYGVKNPAGTKDQKDQIAALKDIIDVVQSSSGVITEAKGKFEAQKAVTKALGNETEKTADKQKGANAEWKIGADVTGDMSGEVETLADAFEELTGATLNEREARRSWFSALRDANQALKENGQTLDVTTEKGSANAAALDSIAEASMDLLSSMDEQGRKHRDIAKTFEQQHDALIRQAQAFGMSRKAAENYADRVHQLPASVTTEVKTPGAKESADDLKTVDSRARKIQDQLDLPVNAPGAGKVADQLEDVDGWARTIQDKVDIPTDAPGAPKTTDEFEDLDGWVRTVDDKKEIDTSAPGIDGTRGQMQGLKGDVDSLSGKKVPITLSANATDIIADVGKKIAGIFGFADGAVLDFNANGDVKNGHTAQIAPGGAWRVWAEPETQGEAYIPFAPSKRERSLDIWRETGRRLGVEPEFYADGAIRVEAGTRVNGNPRRDARTIDHMYDAVAAGMGKSISKYLSEKIESINLGGGFHWPVPRKYGYTGTWGHYSSGGSHPALDFPAPTGTDIYSVLPGKVTGTTSLGDTSYGNYTEINHGHGISSLYAHQSAFKTHKGARVQSGDHIGEVGDVGNTTGPHLHLELKRGGTSFDFTSWLHGGGPAWTQGGTGLPSKYDLSGSGVARYTPVVKDVLKALHGRSSALPSVLARMNQESGGNPTIVNDWDSNAAAGTPSVGLMQVIGPTYQANKPHPDRGPYKYGTSVDPYSNIYAGLHYARGRYGTIEAGMTQPGGYRHGGPVVGRGGPTSDDILIRASNGEHVWTADEVRRAGGHREVEALRAAARDRRAPDLLGNPDLQGFNTGNDDSSGNTGGGHKGPLGSFNGHDSDDVRVPPGAIRSLKDMLELISKPETVHDLGDLNRAWREMRRETGQLERMEDRLHRARTRSKNATHAANQSEKALEDLRNDHSKAGDRAEAIESKLKDLRHESNDDNKEIERVERELKKAREHDAKLSENQEDRLAKARRRSREASEKVETTEKLLNKLRNAEHPQKKKIAEVEDRLRDQRDKAKDAASSLADIEHKLGSSHKEVAKLEKELARRRAHSGKETKKAQELEQKLNQALHDENTTGKEIEKLRDRLHKQRERAKNAGKNLEQQEHAVEKQRDALSKATERWKNMQQELIENAKEVASAITALGEVFGGEGTSTTAQGLLNKLSGASESAEDYGRLLKRVKGRGVDQEIIDQILDQGATPEALALLKSLSNAPNSLIKQINRQQGRLEGLANQVGAWTITPQKHQGGGHNDRPQIGHGGAGAGATVRPVNVNINGPVSTTDIKKLGRELESRWNRALVVARGA